MSIESLESLYGVPGFEEPEEVTAEVESDDFENPVDSEPLTAEEEEFFRDMQGLFFSMEAALDGVLLGRAEEPSTPADPEILKKALERQADFLSQFAIA